MPFRFLIKATRRTLVRLFIYFICFGSNIDVLCDKPAQFEIGDDVSVGVVRAVEGLETVAWGHGHCVWSVLLPFRHSNRHGLQAS